jgi:hypothetical protein
MIITVGESGIRPKAQGEFLWWDIWDSNFQILLLAAPANSLVGSKQMLHRRIWKRLL